MFLSICPLFLVCFLSPSLSLFGSLSFFSIFLSRSTFSSFNFAQRSSSSPSYPPFHLVLKYTEKFKWFCRSKRISRWCKWGLKMRRQRQQNISEKSQLTVFVWRWWKVVMASSSHTMNSTKDLIYVTNKFMGISLINLFRLWTIRIFLLIFHVAHNFSSNVHSQCSFFLFDCFCWTPSIIKLLHL